jgi:hypothetical protein
MEHFPIPKGDPVFLNENMQEKEKNSATQSSFLNENICKRKKRIQQPNQVS